MLFFLHVLPCLTCSPITHTNLTCPMRLISFFLYIVVLKFSSLKTHPHKALNKSLNQSSLTQNECIQLHLFFWKTYIFISFLYVQIFCLNVWLCTMCLLCLQRPKKDLGCLELKLQTVVSHHMNIRNRCFICLKRKNHS